MGNLINNIRTEWPTVVATIAFVAAGACTYALIRIVSKFVLAVIGPIEDDLVEEEDFR